MSDEQKKTPDLVESVRADSRSGVDESAALPSRLERYAVAHKRAVDMADYIKANVKGQARIVHDLKHCGSYLVFRDYYTVGLVRLAGMCSCKKHLLCPLCAIRRGAKMLKSYLAKFQVVTAENSNLKPYLVTLTIRNGDNLSERYSHLHSSFKRYRKARNSAVRNKGPMVEFAKAQGAVWSYEFKRGKNSGGWHPHVHGVWMCESAPIAEQLAQDWHRITGDSYIVDVRSITTEDDAVGGFLEVFKYAVKFAELPYADNWEGFRVLQGRRMVSSSGVFYGIDAPADLKDELLAEDLPYVELLYKYRPNIGYNLENYEQHVPECA